MRPEAKTFRASDGRELTFLFTMEGMIAAENAADAPFAEVVTGAAKARIGHLRALIYGGLKAGGEKVTLAECGEMIEREGAALGEALWAALQSAMPEPAKDGEAGPRKAGGGTGTRSSPRGSKKA